MSDSTAPSTEKHAAGLFDIRVIIGALIGIYGVIVLLTGLIGSDNRVQNSKAINIWVGIGMLVVSAFFIVWARVRPIVVPDDVDSADAESRADSGGAPTGH